MKFSSALLFALGVAGFDQVTKRIIDASFALGEVLPVIPGFFSLTHSRNRGAAFGMFAELPDPWRGLLLVFFAGFVVVLLTWMMASTPQEDRWQRVAIASVIGGALGNLYDRVVVGEVIDFLDVYVGSAHWPTFNVADSFITVGVILLLFSSFFGESDPDPVVAGPKTE